MAESIRRNVSREAVVITDPVEGPRGFPRFAPRLPRLRASWFGHPSNLNGLVHRSGELAALAERFPVHLSIVTAPSAVATALALVIAASIPAKLLVHIGPLSTDSTWLPLARSDLVVI